ncbi:hypothetical protein [Marinilabilia sp.]|uniref:hypothetical protein n=1 Tax=Marinilabilia sp. TaxID=2021252 RepID=UPI0025C2AD5E|nr:hypothetical protein [Marinilabilia sp.]
MLDLILEILLIGIFGRIAFEDFKTRQVHLLLFVFGFLTAVLLSIERSFHYEFLLFNMVFVLINLLAVFGYGFIKGKSLTLNNKWFGLGDLLMWSILIFCFSPINFILFFIGSLFFSLLTYIFFFRKHNTLIPLAGNQSLCMVIVILGDLLGVSINFLLNDMWIVLDV